jgi:hypothetical protein
MKLNDLVLCGVMLEYDIMQNEFLKQFFGEAALRFTGRQLTRLNKRYNNISPEKQYIVAAMATYFYLVIILTPEKLPQSAQDLLIAQEIININTQEIWLASLLTFIVSADGARKIVFNQLPLYKAYVRVFLLENERTK